MRNLDGLVLNRLRILITGSARSPNANRALEIGMSAASPAPSQCIRPVATKTIDSPSTNQKALRQINERRCSGFRRLITDHQYQIEMAMARSNSNLGIGLAVKTCLDNITIQGYCSQSE